MGIRYVLAPITGTRPSLPTEAGSNGCSTCAEFALTPSWADVPLERALLSHELDGIIPESADWRVSPGSGEGVALYRSYLSLQTRWLERFDDIPSSLIDGSWARVVMPNEVTKGDVDVSSAMLALRRFLRALEEQGSHKLADEASSALGLLALCSLLSGGKCVVRRHEWRERRPEGPIHYLTSGLEGFGSFRRVQRASEGQSVLFEYPSHYAYNVPAEFIANWFALPGATNEVVSTRVSSRSGAARVTFAGGSDVFVSPETVLLNCEPLYSPGKLDDEGRDFLLLGQQAYGRLRVTASGQRAVTRDVGVGPGNST